jgi:hypothetical protein
MSKPTTVTKSTDAPNVREHWTTAPAIIRGRIESLKVDAQNLRIDSPALVRGCFSYGYDLTRDEIPTPVLKALAAGVPRSEINQRYGSMREQSEQLALTIWDQRAEWRKTTLDGERATTRAATDTAARDALVRQRASEILAERSRHAEAEALALAEKEIA